MTRYDLEIIWRLRKKFSLLEEELKALREAAENISPVIDGLPKSKNATSKVENLSVKILDTEEKLIEMTGEFIKLFERELPDEIACIFILRYVACRTWREIAQGYRRTLKWSYLAHAKGLKILEKVQFFAQD